MRPTNQVPILLSILTLLGFSVSADTAHAACNLPTASLVPHPAEHGGIDSPFLFVNDARTIVAPSMVATDRVTLAYMPADGADVAPALVVLASDCTGVENSCNGMVKECLKQTFQMGTTGSGEATLTFEVPEYKENGETRGGHVRIAVAAGTSQVACNLGDPALNCPSSLPAGTRACLDVLTPLASDAKSAITTITALPDLNDFSKVCDTSPNGVVKKCKGNGVGLDFAVDAHGDILIPADWDKLIRKTGTNGDDCHPPTDTCDTTPVSAATSLPKKRGTRVPIAIPVGDSNAVQSFNLEGGVFANQPRFQVVDGGGSGELRLAGDTDKPRSVLRIRRCPNGQVGCSDADAYFDMAARVKKGGAAKVPKTGKKSGACDDDNAAACSSNADCSANVTCLWVGGETGKPDKPRVLLATVEDVPPPPPPPPAPEEAEDPPVAAAAAPEAAAETVAAPPPPRGPSADRTQMNWWLFALVAIGLAWLFARRRGI